MIQFNLLPDVKLDFVKAQRTKHTVISVAIIAASSSFVIFLLLFLTVNVFQKKSISDLNGDITKYSSQLKATPDINKILTIQSQLSSLTALHADKPAAVRTFPFIQQLTPLGVSLSEVSVDYTANTMQISGLTSSLDQVNTYTDTLKFTKFTAGDGEPEAAFSDIVMSQFSRTTTGATFAITLSYNPLVFDNADNVTLTVPKTVTTQSIIQQPEFKQTTNGNTN